MDETPYPAPAAAYEPVDAQPPQYSPEAPDSAKPPKSKALLIVGIVIIVLLLCCCGSGVGGYLLFGAADEDATTNLEESIGEAIGGALTEPDGGVTEGASTGVATGWEEFDPAAYDPAEWVAPDAFHEEVLADAMSSLFPEFELRERLARPSTEYSTDTVLARATLKSDPDVAIAFWLEVENTPAFESGWVWDPERDGYDYMDVATAANGREYSWDKTELVPLLFGIRDAATGDLVKAAANDFPGSVLCIVEHDGETGQVELTRWVAYPDYDASYYAEYTREGDSWTLVEAGAQ